MTGQTAARKTGKPLTRGEVVGLMRRSYNRPLEPVPPLHVMARRRGNLAENNRTPSEETTS